MSQEWHYAQNGERFGPVAMTELSEMLQSGRLRAHELVWHPSMSDWQAAKDVPQLQSHFAGRESAAPVSAIAYEGPSFDPVPISERAITSLRQTKPWARLISIVMLVGAAFMLLAGIGMSMGIGRAGGFGASGAFVLVYGATALLYVAPAIYLSRYATRIGDLLRTRRTTDLEAALEAQKSFWKFCGIVLTVILCLYGVGILIGLLVLVIRLL